MRRGGPVTTLSPMRRGPRHAKRWFSDGSEQRCLTISHHELYPLASLWVSKSPRKQPFHSATSLNFSNGQLQRNTQYPIDAWTHRAVPGHTSESTIYALSTAPGRAGIAIVRISGSNALSIYRKLCPGFRDPRPRYAAVRSIYEPDLPPSPDTTLDSNAMVLFFPGPKSVTGEDILELHVHGGPAIVKAVLSAIPKCSSVAGTIRYAEPGEFTRRAFMNDRLDLIQVEALGDSLAAMTEKQRRVAVRGTTSQLGRQYEQWRQQLLYARGELEALIDFSEDQHFDESPAELIASVAGQVEVLRAALAAHTQNAVRGEMLRNGISISLLGAPNAGKSSLLNRIVGREAAIVSQEAGTTRDVVEVSVDIGGFLCRFGDTAGLRRALNLRQPDASNTAEIIGLVEQEGIRRAKARAAESDLVVVVLSFETRSANSMPELVIDPEVASTIQTLLQADRDILIAVNKSDRIPSNHSTTKIVDQIQSLDPSLPSSSIQFISCLPTTPITPFLTALSSKLTAMTSALSPSSDPDPDKSIWEDSLGATSRQRALLEECLSHLGMFLSVAGTGPRDPQRNPSDVAQLEGYHHHHRQQQRVGGVEGGEVDFVLAAEHLRAAAGCLARITGRSCEAGDVEEVLGVVFEKFCVGK
ncbi:P-loop containing nucleoside triphosphate hydrolase protein [Myriangium duriaei CBS 260.36]|uniref:P-loop containing nucleoside triphosphate hydrolase protein n=1 Tax=Myriangium duriaei CBS 260.36 TaxID=1168546 RepID=A0A9P4MH81_9PEZI|nr:P-loop containing nucleoside triphosphate hydrolase protein [Myriangium duriaei CBS 260.36]